MQTLPSWLRWLPVLALLLAPGLACEEEIDEEPFCGDGLLDPGEDCDDGEANSDTAADACRLDCLLPICGDGTVDSGEHCDDGEHWGGDGCSPSCLAEDGALEQELNDSIEQANSLEGAETMTGALPPGDRDCFSLELPPDGWLSADVIGEGGECPDLGLSLYDPEGALLAVGTPGTDGGCSPLDPLTDEGASFMAEGTWTVCAEGFLDAVVPTYTLDWTVGDDSCELELSVLPSEDLDGDGSLNICDEDDDGDGVDDVDDNCPDVPNGPDMPTLYTGEDGFLRHWLLIGPFEGTETEADCRPSEDQLLGDDAAASPAVADTVDDLTWWIRVSTDARIALGMALGGSAPRESYGAVWLRSDSARSAVLALGPDDGARAWLNGVEVAEIDGCQGTNVDQFQFDVELQEGWNRLMVKTRDNGGAWGKYVRLLDPETAAPLDDLEISLMADSPWVDNQGDQDGDGVGDACDSSPAG